MRNPSDAVRDHLVRLLDWEDAHVGFDKSVAGLAAEARGARPPGVEHSVWQLLEHIRLGQEDILQFCLERRTRTTWCGPTTLAEGAVAAGRPGVARQHRRLPALAGTAPAAHPDAVDLTVSVPTGKPAQTYLRAILLAADDVAYHVGQIVMVRKALGAWV